MHIAAYFTAVFLSTPPLFLASSWCGVIVPGVCCLIMETHPSFPPFIHPTILRVPGMLKQQLYHASLHRCFASIHSRQNKTEGVTRTTTLKETLWVTYEHTSSKSQIRFEPPWRLVTGVYLQRMVLLQSPSTSLHCTAAFISNCAGIKEADLANKSCYARCHGGCASGTGTSFSSCTSRGTSGN